MTRPSWTIAVLAVLALVAPAPLAHAQPRYAGRPLAEALQQLSRQGLRIVFSTELVRPEMRVAQEPRATAPRDILTEILAPHGLTVRPGPRDTLLVIRTAVTTRQSPPAPPRTGIIAGTVVDARTATPLPGVVVQLQGRDEVVVTDRDGGFEIGAVAIGTQKLTVSMVGYALAKPAVTVPEGRVELTVPLSGGTGAYTEHVTVTADRFRPFGTEGPAVQSAGNAELQALGGVLSGDPLRAAQTLPGVAAVDDFRSEFSVRGSDPDHLAVTVDGVLTPWPIHAVRRYEDNGSIALINSDVLDGLAVSAAAYPQDQPGRTGARVDLTLREGSRSARQFRTTVSATSAALVAEGPFGDAGRGSWLVSARQSYLQWLVNRLDPNGAKGFTFTDTQAKLVFDVTPRQRLDVTVVAGRSRLEDEQQHADRRAVGDGRANGGLGALAWRSTVGSSIVITQRASLAGGTFDNETRNGEHLGNGSARQLTYRAAVEWTPRPSLVGRAGMHVAHNAERHEFTRYVPASNRVLSETADGSAVTWSGDLRLTWRCRCGVQADGGVLGTHATLTDEDAASPWIAVALPVAAGVKLRAGAGVYQQFPGIEQAIGSFGGPDVGRERARHLDAGVEVRQGSTVRWLVTAYERREQDVLTLLDFEARLVSGLGSVPPALPAWRNRLEGHARGVEFSVERRATTGLTGWIGYAFARADYTETATGETFAADYDQRHTFNSWGQYRVTPRTSVGVKLRVGSQFPLRGYFDVLDGLVQLSVSRNRYRLPAYSRLDLRADHTFLYERRRLTLFVEVINVLNRSNQVGPASFQGVGVPLSRVTSTMFPIVPSAGFTFEF